jgi:hypothetical protein
MAAAQIAVENGTNRPALPRRRLEKETGLGLTAVRTALTRLAGKKLLALEVRGRPAGPGSQKRHANLYRLPSLTLHAPDAQTLAEAVRLLAPLQALDAPDREVDEPLGKVLPLRRYPGGS